MEGLVDTAHQQEGSGQIMHSLKYQLPDTASYMTDRRAATFFANCTDYNPQGIRVIPVKFADLSTL
eukprot:1384956-Prorocentrum_lima.AAC.1